MKPFLLTLLLFVCSNVINASDNFHTLFYAQSSTASGVLSLNPAGKSFAEKLAFGLVVENRFGLKELSTGFASVIYPSKIGNIGLTLSST